MKRSLKILLWVLLTPPLIVAWLWTLGAAYYMAGGGESMGASSLGARSAYEFLGMTMRAARSLVN